MIPHVERSTERFARKQHSTTLRSPFRKDRRVRIGTWNLAGRWSDRHREVLDSADCDVWLLTEVSYRLSLPGYWGHVTITDMRPEVRWAGIFSRFELEPLHDPHPASAMARVGQTTFVSTILPWRGTGDVEPWHGTNHGERTRAALRTLVPAMPEGDLCWGGDWNHAMSGREYAGNKGGREAVLGAVSERDLAVPTAQLPHAIDGLLTIDHVAVPSAWEVLTAARVPAVSDSMRLSDHDLYLIEV